MREFNLREFFSRIRDSQYSLQEYCAVNSDDFQRLLGYLRQIPVPEDVSMGPYAEAFSMIDTMVQIGANGTYQIIGGQEAAFWADDNLLTPLPDAEIAMYRQHGIPLPSVDRSLGLGGAYLVYTSIYHTSLDDLIAKCNISALIIKFTQLTDRSLDLLPYLLVNKESYTGRREFFTFLHRAVSAETRLTQEQLSSFLDRMPDLQKLQYITLKDHNGCTAINLARGVGSADIADYLQGIVTLLQEREPDGEIIAIEAEDRQVIRGGAREIENAHNVGVFGSAKDSAIRLKRYYEADGRAADVRQRLLEIQAWVVYLAEREGGQNSIEIQSARRLIDALVTKGRLDRSDGGLFPVDYSEVFIDGNGNSITGMEALVYCWIGINDKDCMSSRRLSDSDIALRRGQFIWTLYQIKRGYNIDGLVDDMTPVDRHVCNVGAFSRIIRCLDRCHDQVRIYELNEGVVFSLFWHSILLAIQERFATIETTYVNKQRLVDAWCRDGKLPEELYDLVGGDEICRAAYQEYGNYLPDERWQMVVRYVKGTSDLIGQSTAITRDLLGHLRGVLVDQRDALSIEMSLIAEILAGERGAYTITANGIEYTLAWLLKNGYVTAALVFIQRYNVKGPVIADRDIKTLNECFRSIEIPDETLATSSKELRLQYYILKLDTGSLANLIEREFSLNEISSVAHKLRVVFESAEARLVARACVAKIACSINTINPFDNWEAIGRLVDVLPSMDREVIVNDYIVPYIMQNPNAIRGIDFSFYSAEEERKIIITAVRRNGKVLYFAPSSLKRDKGVVIAAVSQNGRALGCADDHLRSDKEVVLTAVTQRGESLRFASAQLQSDRAIVMAAVNQNGWAIRFASAQLRGDREVVMAAIRQNTDALAYSSIQIRGDREAVLVAVNQNGTAIRFASDDLIGDREVVMAAVRQSGWAIRFVSDQLMGDRGVVMAAVRQNGWAIQFASEQLRGDIGVVMAAISQNGWAIRFASDQLKSQRRVVMMAVSRSGTALCFLYDCFRGDKEVVMAAVGQNGSALESASADLQDDIEVVIASVEQNGNAIEFASDRLRGDRGVLMAAVSQDGVALRYVSTNFRNDRAIVMAAVSQNGIALQFASVYLKQDKGLVMTAVRENGSALKYASAHLKNDKEVVMAAVIQNGCIFRCASANLRKDKEIAVAAVTQDGYALQFASDQLRGDIDVVIAAVSQNGNALHFASTEIRGDRRFCDAASETLEFFDDFNAAQKAVVIRLLLSPENNLSRNQIRNLSTALGDSFLELTGGPEGDKMKIAKLLYQNKNIRSRYFASRDAQEEFGNYSLSIIEILRGIERDTDDKKAQLFAKKALQSLDFLSSGVSFQYIAITISDFFINFFALFGINKERAEIIRISKNFARNLHADVDTALDLSTKNILRKAMQEIEEVGIKAIDHLPRVERFNAFRGPCALL